MQAAWAHYALVAIHPFADGNGRVARALASVFLYRRPGVPLVIFADQKDTYLDALEEADAGRPVDFLHFILDRVADVVGLVQVAAQSAARPADASISELRDALLRAERFPPEEATGIAGRLLTTVYADLRDRMASLKLPDGVHMSVSDTTPAARTAGGVPQLLIQLDADAPADTSVVDAVTVAISWKQEKPTFGIRTSGSHPELTIELRDTFPTFSGLLELKLQLWVEGLIDHLVFQLGSRHAQRCANEASARPRSAVWRGRRGGRGRPGCRGERGPGSRR
jgi:hypothetical protein